MKRLVLDDLLNIVNEEKEKRGLENYAPCYPMLRIVNDKLYIAVLISNVEEDIWNIDSNSKPEYWCLIDIDSLKIIEFNNTSDKDYVIDKLNSDNKDGKNELSRFETLKEKEYIDYLLNDIRNSDIPLQSDLFKCLNGEIEIDNKNVNINDYIMDNLKEIVKIKAKEIVDILVQSKYSLITICYDNLFNQIIKEYKENNIINKDKMRLCIRVMNNYYYGIVGIEEFFNI